MLKNFSSTSWNWDFTSCKTCGILFHLEILSCLKKKKKNKKVVFAPRQVLLFLPIIIQSHLLDICNTQIKESVNCLILLLFWDGNPSAASPRAHISPQGRNLFCCFIMRSAQNFLFKPWRFACGASGQCHQLFNPHVCHGEYVWMFSGQNNGIFGYFLRSIWEKTPSRVFWGTFQQQWTQ